MPAMGVIPMPALAMATGRLVYFFFDVFTHYRQRCLENGAGCVREHDASFHNDRLNLAVSRLAVPPWQPWRSWRRV